MKKTLYLLICLAMLAGITACGGGGNNNREATYSWWMYSQANDWYTSYNDNAVVKYLENRFNVTFRFEEPVAGTEADALALMMGTGRYTDVMDLSNYTGSHSELYDNGTIIDIAQYLDYMPNLKNLIETVPGFAQGAYTDDGRILAFPSYADGLVPPWAGLVYRRDILETMTGGNVQFPSGNSDPTTLDDWEYMLPLYKMYFEAAGMVEYAPLIIPATAIFHYGELMSTFGAYYAYYLRDDVIHAGMLEEGMYNYIAKLREWYEAGYIYKDFASRLQDMFFMPNPALTYGGAAGIWYGMAMNLGDRMSLPEHGLYFDVRGIPSPTSPGITYKDMLTAYNSLYGGAGFGSAVSTKCQNIEKLLGILDIFYTNEGGLLRTYGLTKEQIPPRYTIYDRMGLSNGAYWFENGNMILNPNLDEVGGTIGRDRVNGIRFPGYEMISFALQLADEETQKARRAWSAQEDESETFRLPDRLFYTTQESLAMSSNNARINDLTNEMIPKFIMGAVPLNRNTWNTFINQLKDNGIEENRDIIQAAYNRFMARGK